VNLVIHWICSSIGGRSRLLESYSICQLRRVEFLRQSANLTAIILTIVSIILSKWNHRYLPAVEQLKLQISTSQPVVAENFLMQLS
jgi:hypothetical protein